MPCQRGECTTRCGRGSFGYQIEGSGRGGGLGQGLARRFGGIILIGHFRADLDAQYLSKFVCLGAAEIRLFAAIVVHKTIVVVANVVAVVVVVSFALIHVFIILMLIICSWCRWRATLFF